MNANEKVLNTFATRVRQMILQYADIKEQNEQLKAELINHKEEIRKLQEQISGLQSDYQNLKMARMIEISDADMETTQKRIAKLIRDVNKCLTLLGEK